MKKIGSKKATVDVGFHSSEETAIHIEVYVKTNSFGLVPIHGLETSFPSQNIRLEPLSNSPANHAIFGFISLKVSRFGFWLPAESCHSIGNHGFCPEPRPLFKFL